MPKVLSAIYSYEDMKEKWSQDNPNDKPYTRRPDLESGIYELDKWIIRVNDEGKTISTVGWKEHPSHTVVGGMLATTEGKKIGQNNRVLNDAREPQLNQSKPLVAAFGFRDGDNARWIAKAKQNGWKFPDDSEFEQMKQLLPESVFNEWNSAYPNGNWAIRSIRGEGEMAKCVYLDDPISDWFNMLKYLPDESFEEYSLGEPVADLGTRDRFKDKNIRSKGNKEYKAFVSEQYLRQVNDRIPDAGNSKMKTWLEKLNGLNLKKGKYWYFGTNVYEDKTYVMIDVINKGDRFLGTSKKFNLEGMDSAIIFVGVSKSMVGKIKRGQTVPKGRKFIDLWGKGGLRGLPKKRSFDKEPKNIFQKWQAIIKWRPDETFQSQKGDEIISPDKYSSNYKVRIKPHYMDKGNTRLNEEDYYNRTDMIPELINKLNTHPDTQEYRGKIWFYFNDDKFDLSYVDGKIISNSPTNEYLFESVRSLEFIGGKRAYIGYPVKRGYKFIDIHNTGIKEFHTAGMDKNVFLNNSKADLRRKHEGKNKPKSVYSEAKTGDEAYDIYKETYYIPFEEKVQTLRNKRDNATNPATKEKAQKQIDKLEREQRKEYERYKRIALRLGD